MAAGRVVPAGLIDGGGFGLKAALGHVPNGHGSDPTRAAIPFRRDGSEGGSGSATWAAR